VEAFAARFKGWAAWPRPRLNNGTWSVVVTARAPKWVIDFFVDHYLANGATRIFLFFDDPEVAFSIPDPRVETVICDSAYWQGSRPRDLQDRQQVNAGRALPNTDATWMLHVDTDEILISTTPIAQRLAEIDDDVFSVLVKPVEAVYAAAPTVQTAFATPYFKQPLVGWPRWRSRRIVQECLGPYARLSSSGLFGHVVGKSFFRVACANGSLPIDRPSEPVNGMRIDVRASEFRLLHFDALTYDIWQSKFLRRLDGQMPAEMRQKRIRQLDMIRGIRETKGEAGLYALYRSMVVMDPDRLRRAREKGFVVEILR
jgi:hypothetical protein